MFWWGVVATIVVETYLIIGIMIYCVYKSRK